MKHLRALFILIVLFVCAYSAEAQTSLILCFNAKTRDLRVDSTNCPSGYTKLTGNNFGSLVSTKGVNYSQCYTQTGVTSGTPASGQLTVALSCKKTTDVVIEDAFSPSNLNTGAYPVLASKVILYSKGLPNGVQFTSQAAGSLFYRLSVSIVCCPQ